MMISPVSVLYHNVLQRESLYDSACVEALWCPFGLRYALEYNSGKLHLIVTEISQDGLGHPSNVNTAKSIVRSRM